MKTTKSLEHSVNASQKYLFRSCSSNLRWRDYFLFPSSLKKVTTFGIFRRHLIRRDTVSDISKRILELLLSMAATSRQCMFLQNVTTLNGIATDSPNYFFHPHTSYDEFVGKWIYLSTTENISLSSEQQVDIQRK